MRCNTHTFGNRFVIICICVVPHAYNSPSVGIHFNIYADVFLLSSFALWLRRDARAFSPQRICRDDSKWIMLRHLDTFYCRCVILAPVPLLKYSVENSIYRKKRCSKSHRCTANGMELNSSQSNCEKSFDSIQIGTSANGTWCHMDAQAHVDRNHLCASASGRNFYWILFDAKN